MMAAGGEKAARKAVGRPFAKGADPRRNTTTPGTGRPPDAFKELCRELTSGEKTVKQLQAILKNADHPQFMAAVRWASEHGYGKPVQPVDVNVTGNLAIRLKQARERVNG